MASKFMSNVLRDIFGVRVHVMRVVCATLLFAALFSFNYRARGWQSRELAASQPGDRVYYAESWKKGSRQIQERSFYKKLNAYDPSFEAVLKDSSGSNQFRLLVDPLYYVWDARGKLKFKNQPSVPQSKVNFWDVKLLDSAEQVSLLMVNRDQGHFMDWRNTLATLDPVEDDKGWMVGISGVPISSKRVIKVEGFYCVINVLNYQLNQKLRAFEWLDLEIVLTNNKPYIVDQAVR